MVNRPTPTLICSRKNFRNSGSSPKLTLKQALSQKKHW
jgi:hypothetical protein